MICVVVINVLHPKLRRRTVPFQVAGLDVEAKKDPMLISLTYAAQEGLQQYLSPDQTPSLSSVKPSPTSEAMAVRFLKDAREIPRVCGPETAPSNNQTEDDKDRIWLQE